MSQSNQKPTKEAGSGRGGTWLIVIIILVLIAILWPILRRNSNNDETIVAPESTATTTVSDELMTEENGLINANSAFTPALNNLASPAVSSLAPNTPLTFRIFFGNNNQTNSEGFRCEVVYPVSRTAPRTVAVARAALTELLRGPSAAERAAGLFTSINPGVKIQKLTIANGVARVDFNEALETGVAGSCLTSSIRAQITETLKQFPTVNSVIISVNGETEEILQP